MKERKTFDVLAEILADEISITNFGILTNPNISLFTNGDLVLEGHFIFVNEKKGQTFYAISSEKSFAKFDVNKGSIKTVYLFKLIDE